MSVKQGGNTIAGASTVDQVYDGTSTNAQSGTAVAGAISNMVTTDTAQTISGAKTFSSNIELNNGARLYVIHAPEAKGTPPAATTWYELLAQDNAAGTGKDHRFGALSFTNNTDGSIKAALICYKNEANSTSSGIISIQVNSSGTYTTTAPTPAASSNTTNIATTAWVKSFANTSGANYMTTFSKGGNGYFKFTNGLIIQWGTSTKGSSKTVTLPTAFSSTNYKVAVNNQTDNGGGYYSSATTKTTTTFVIHSSSGAASFDNDWIAIGY